MAKVRGKEAADILKEKLGLSVKTFVKSAERKELLARLTETQPLPRGIYYDAAQNDFFRYVSASDVSPEEELEYLRLYNAANLKTIQRCAVFFTVITAIGMIAAVIMGLLQVRI